jgi:hypothetical protein
MPPLALKSNSQVQLDIRLWVADDCRFGSNKRFAAEGPVGHLQITEPDGDPFPDMPRTIGVIADGAFGIAIPFIAAIDALADFVPKVQD